MGFSIIALIFGLVLGLCLVGIGMDLGGKMNDSGTQVRHEPPDPEEIELVLYNLRLGASEREKRVIDFLIDKEGVEYDDGK